jgi:hypothetical protein
MWITIVIFALAAGICFSVAAVIIQDERVLLHFGRRRQWLVRCRRVLGSSAIVFAGNAEGEAQCRKDESSIAAQTAIHGFLGGSRPTGMPS